MMFLYLSPLNLAFVPLVARATHVKQWNQKRYVTLEDMI
jgi:hypothetical protein